MLSNVQHDLKAFSVLRLGGSSFFIDKISLSRRALLTVEWVGMAVSFNAVLKFSMVVLRRLQSDIIALSLAVLGTPPSIKLDHKNKYDKQHGQAWA